MTGSPSDVGAEPGDPDDPDPSGVGDLGVADAAAALDRVEAALGGVVAALTRLDDGRYPYCTRCGAPLDRARLAADPLTEHCPDRCGETP